MRKLLLSLSMLAGVAAAVPASAAMLHPAVAPVAAKGPIVEAYLEHHHWVPPHRDWHRDWHRHGWYGGRFYR